jgi:hypothetical protein
MNDYPVAHETDEKKKKGIGQCAFESHEGRCGLRGAIGHAGPSNDGWYCAFHNRVLCRAHDGDVLIQNSIDGLRRVIRIEKEQGATRWDHRTLEEWWALAEGTKRPLECKNIPGESGANGGIVDDFLMPVTG